MNLNARIIDELARYREHIDWLTLRVVPVDDLHARLTWQDGGNQYDVTIDATEDPAIPDNAVDLAVAYRVARDTLREALCFAPGAEMDFDNETAAALRRAAR